MFRIGVVVTLILLTVTCAFACGDKLLFLGSGISFGQIHRTEHPASVLIYMNESSELPAADKGVQLQTVLKLAGHKLKSIESRKEFQRALSSGTYDVVVVGLSDAIILESEVQAAPGRPLLLPLLYKPNNDQLAAAQKQFSCAFKAEKNNQILRILDEAMKNKQKDSGPKCPTR
jgi:hypothetical protein